MRRIGWYAWFPNMLPEPTQKIEELESIRGIAALLVVMFHMPAWNPRLNDIQFIHNGFYMVDLFFVLSGFVMNLNYGDRLKSGRDLARFQLLRLGRLYPVHLLFLLLAIITAASSWMAATVLGLAIPNGSGGLKDATFAVFAEQLLLIHALGFFTIKHPFNLPSWSISVEFYTYLLFGILCLISHRVLRFCAFALLTGLALVLLSGVDKIGNFSQILQCFAGYFLGCIVASFVANGAFGLPRISTFVALAFMALFLSTRNEPQFDITIFFLSALLIVAVTCSGDNPAKAVLRHKSLKFLGLISYSIYMSHSFVLWVCNQFVRVVLRRPESVSAGISTPQLSLPSALLWEGIAIACTILLSALVFKYVEDPWRLKSKAFARRFMSGARGLAGRAALRNVE